MEKEIRTLLLTIPEVKSVHYMVAPKLTESPYLVIKMNREEPEYTLNGAIDSNYLTFDINLYSKTFPTLKIISKQVKTKLLNLLGTNLGDFYIQSVKVNKSDFYDSQIDMNRTAIELEIYT